MRPISIYKTFFLPLLIIAAALVVSCSSSTKVPGTKVHYTTMELEPVSDTGEEYDIIITDPGYESFLITQKPMNFYSQQYYESWNRYYVNDWNTKVTTQQYHSPRYEGIFDTYINYEPNTNYGMLVNYKLYNYFLFVQNRYGVVFNVPRAISYQ